VCVIAATNRVSDLDDAIIRRFESRVFCGLPDQRTRKDMIQKSLAGVTTVLDDQDFDNLAALSEGCSGADIDVFTREAAMGPVRRLIAETGSVQLLDTIATECGPVLLSDLEESLLRL
jgi:SpoVK/Ycf46/Vps4 family AAA+-type ATPase